MDDNGISITGDIVDIGVQEHIIEKSGSFFKYNGEVLAQGREATKQNLAENPDLMKKIQKQIWDKIKAKQA